MPGTLKRGFEKVQQAKQYYSLHFFDVNIFFVKIPVFSAFFLSHCLMSLHRRGFLTFFSNFFYVCSLI